MENSTPITSQQGYSTGDISFSDMSVAHEKQLHLCKVENEYHNSDLGQISMVHGGDVNYYHGRYVSPVLFLYFWCRCEYAHL